MLTDETRRMIVLTLKQLADTVHNETGEHMLIGWGMTDKGTIIEGCVASPKMDYGSACKVLCGITAFAIDWYRFEDDSVSLG